MHERVEHGPDGRQGPGRRRDGGRAGGPIGRCAGRPAGGPLRGPRPVAGGGAGAVRPLRPRGRPGAGPAGRGDRAGGAARSDGGPGRCRPGRGCGPARRARRGRAGARSRAGAAVAASRWSRRRRGRRRLGLLPGSPSPRCGSAAGASPCRPRSSSPSEPGETVWDVAARVAPGRPGAELAAVAERIVADNALRLGARCSPVRCSGCRSADALRTRATKVRAARPTFRSIRRSDGVSRFPYPYMLWLHSCCSSTGGDARAAGGGRRCAARSAGTRTAGSSTPARSTTARPSAAGGPARVRPAVHHGRGGGARGGQAQRRHRAVQPGQGRQRRPQGLPGPAVDEDALALLAQRVEEAVRAGGAAEVPSHEVGLAILGPLRELDEVAYLRFASVYRSFASLEDFEKEIADLRTGGRRRPTAPHRAAVTARRSAPRSRRAAPQHQSGQHRGRCAPVRPSHRSSATRESARA